MSNRLKFQSQGQHLVQSSGYIFYTDINEVGQGFDAVYSCHVLEHTPNPREVLLKQLSLVKPGGLVAAHTPNGSKGFRLNNYADFHRDMGAGSSSSVDGTWLRL